MTRTTTGLLRVPVDFNDYAAFDPMWGGLPDDDEDLHEGDEVIAYDTDNEPVLCARGRVTRIDRAKGLVYLHVDGDSFYEDEFFYGDDPTPPAAAQA